MHATLATVDVTCQLLYECDVSNRRRIFMRHLGRRHYTTAPTIHLTLSQRKFYQENVNYYNFTKVKFKKINLMRLNLQPLCDVLSFKKFIMKL
jgi:hypothetical protein